jgi:preprotein translocase subunit SecE
MLDKVKLVIAVLLVAGGIYGYYHFEADYALLYRVLGLLVVVGVALGIAAVTDLGRQAISFGRAASIEVRKSVWPSRRETTQTVLIVVVMVTLVGLMIWGIDSVLRIAVRALI